MAATFTSLALPLQMPPRSLYRSSAVRCCELPEGDNLECTGRIVTELKATGDDALPDRFMFAMRAIRGEFSPPDGAEDNENVDGALTEALLSFPAKVNLRVVSARPPACTLMCSLPHAMLHLLWPL